MADDIVDLTEIRSKHDSRYVTVKKALEDAVPQAEENGWTKCLMVFYREDEGQFSVDMRCAGLTTLEARGLMLSWIREEFTE